MKTPTTVLHPSLLRLFARAGLAPVSRNRKRAFAHRLSRARLNAPTYQGLALETHWGQHRGLCQTPITAASFRSIKFSPAQRIIRRAKKDKKFARELARELAPRNVRSIAAVDAYIKALPARAIAFEALGNPAKIKVATWPANAKALQCGEEEATALKISVCKRGKDWSISGGNQTSHSHAPGVTKWRGGRAVGYSRATNTTTIRAIALVVSPRLVRADLHGKLVSVLAPEGTTWKIDADGVLLSQGRDDYHPEGMDFLASDPAAQMIAALNRNAEARRLTELRALAEIADNAGIFVCLADSLRAGNCRGGTVSFCHKHSLDFARHYSATELLAQANGDSGRVRLAITAAKYRHAREVETGFSLLADHMVTS